MQWRQNLLPLGFLFIILGIFLLWSTSKSVESGVFFVFPFFFGGSGVLGFAITITFVLVFTIIILRFLSIAVLQTDSQSDLNEQNSFILVGSCCAYCSKPIPINSTFCPFCGNPVEQNDG
ncbi:MAG: hypothetical protein OEV85_02675 [Candidatus Thorarchaeota archaeon]|nr:hypothetical protein [Candidatus Thorarchaeota archaeon]